MKSRLFILLALVLLTACGEQPTGIDLTAANNGETINASVGQTLNIKLDSNVTTGYKWNLVTEPTPRILKLVSSQYNAPAGGALGTGGSETWQFQVVGTGTTTLELAYFRPSSPNEVGKVYTMTVQVP